MPLPISWFGAENLLDVSCYGCVVEVHHRDAPLRLLRLLGQGTSGSASTIKYAGSDRRAILVSIRINIG